jgi:hypothetical protein
MYRAVYLLQGTKCRLPERLFCLYESPRWLPDLLTRSVICVVTGDATYDWVVENDERRRFLQLPHVFAPHHPGRPLPERLLAVWASRWCDDL